MDSQFFMCKIKEEKKRKLTNDRSFRDSLKSHNEKTKSFS